MPGAAAEVRAPAAAARVPNPTFDAPSATPVYAVTLPAFEGPLDLLLFFVQRDELDIHDVPLARIADEYLAYVHRLARVDLDGAGEYLYVAALLISIKARSLLPVAPGADAPDADDPQRELADRLAEYVRHKDAARALRDAADARAAHATRTGTLVPIAAPDAPAPQRLADLVEALRRVLTAAPAAFVHAVRRVRVTVEEALAVLWRRLGAEGRVSFADVSAGRDRAFVVAAFLGVLESVRCGRMRLGWGNGDDFFVEQAGEDAAPADLSG